MYIASFMDLTSTESVKLGEVHNDVCSVIWVARSGVQHPIIVYSLPDSAANPNYLQFHRSSSSKPSSSPFE